MRLMILIALAALSLLAKAPEWRMATVVYVHSDRYYDQDVAVQGKSAINSGLHQQLDLDAGHVSYTVEQWVFSGQTLKIAEGTPVQFAIHRKRVLLRTPDGRVRKLRLVREYTKVRR